MTGVVITIKARCRRCYTCVRNCPAKAIKVEDGQAKVIPERCVVCGSCVNACTQSAKRVESEMERVRDMLVGDRPVVACLAPAFPAAFPGVGLGQLVSALKALGFWQVAEVAFGAELVAREHARLLSENHNWPLIASACPAVVGYVEKYLPELASHLAPVVSPMIATGMVVKQGVLPGARTVFIGPCVAKKAEAVDPHVAGLIDAVLTFEELRQMMEAAGIDLNILPDQEASVLQSGLASIFPVSGGLSKAAAIGTDLLDDQVLVAEGKDEVLQFLGELVGGQCSVRFADLLFCRGCIAGPMIGNKLGILARERLVIDHARRRRDQAGEWSDLVEEFSQLDLTRSFGQQSPSLRVPSDEEIGQALRRVNKFTAQDELNCGACGYRSCREKAIAVCQGLAESEMCLPYLVERLQGNLQALERYQQELEEAQCQLIHSERLASMGQLAAAVAHEVNNPLAIVLLNAHLALDELEEEHPARETVSVLVAEAERCKKIVADLLDFARLSELTLTPLDVRDVVTAVLERLALHPSLTNVDTTVELAEVPLILGDANRLERVLLNLIVNAGEAMPDGGKLRVTSGVSDDGRAVWIRVRDSGLGMPPELVERLFTPFFSTKREGKGTGLGLAIAYGIVKRHGGSIAVESEPGRGSAFTVRLPVPDPIAGSQH